jgi:CheY-like chemotaxis protein
MADLYVYFYELGLRVLRPGGLLSFIVTNKWMKAGYGEPLRRFFMERAWVRSVVDFGHAKQIFEEVDVFPSIIVVEKPSDAFSLLLTDIVMPRMDGIELARKASEIDPELKIMFITGFAAVTLNSDKPAPKDARVLSKPFHLKDLVAEVDKLLTGG